jgi:hypothetical protein
LSHGLLGGLLSGLFGGLHLHSGLFGVLIFGLIGSSGLTQLNEIHLVETISWSWHEFWVERDPR